MREIPYRLVLKIPTDYFMHDKSIIVLSSFRFYSVHIDSFISRVARYTPSTTRKNSSLSERNLMIN